MILKTTQLTFFFCFLWIFSAAQRSEKLSLIIQPFLGESLIKQVPYTHNFSDSSEVQIDVLKFYLSNFIGLNSTGDSLRLNGVPTLVDFSQEVAPQLQFEIPKNFEIDRIIFDIGVDSLSNVSGALGGDLDPMHGMYWSWQSGYINFKLEGQSPQCPTRKNKFQFHIGGYQAPYEAIRTVSVSTNSDREQLIYLDIGSLLNYMKEASVYEIMSPNEKSRQFANLLSTRFKTDRP